MLRDIKETLKDPRFGYKYYIWWWKNKIYAVCDVFLFAPFYHIYNQIKNLVMCVKYRFEWHFIKTPEERAELKKAMNVFQKELQREMDQRLVDAWDNRNKKSPNK